MVCASDLDVDTLYNQIVVCASDLDVYTSHDEIDCYVEKDI